MIIPVYDPVKGLIVRTLLSQGNGIAFYLSKEVLRLRGLFTNTDVRKPATEPDAIAYRELRHQVEVLGLARVMTR